MNERKKRITVALQYFSRTNLNRIRGSLGFCPGIVNGLGARDGHAHSVFALERDPLDGPGGDHLIVKMWLRESRPAEWIELSGSLNNQIADLARIHF